MGFARIFAIIVLIVLLIAVGSIFFATHFVTSTVSYVVSSISDASGISPFLVRGVVILLTIPFFWAVGKFTRNILGVLNLGWNTLGFYKNIYGIIIVVYVAAFYLTMYWASRDHLAGKFCADTPEGIFVTDGQGKDPVYGMELKPCSLEQIKILRANKGKIAAPAVLAINDPDTYQWFDPIMGEKHPRVWYSVMPNGDYRFFDRSGADPSSGQPLQPITSEIVQRIRQQFTATAESKQKAAEAETQEKKHRQTAAEQEVVRKREAASVEALAEHAQDEFDGNNFKAARQDCDKVLAQDSRNAVCDTIRQRASIKIAHELVTKGRAQFEHAEFDDAIWNAEEAIRLDPGNASAVKLRDLAKQMKARGVN